MIHTRTIAHMLACAECRSEYARRIQRGGGRKPGSVSSREARRAARARWNPKQAKKVLDDWDEAVLDTTPAPGSFAHALEVRIEDRLKHGWTKNPPPWRKRKPAEKRKKESRST